MVDRGSSDADAAPEDEDEDTEGAHHASHDMGGMVQRYAMQRIIDCSNSEHSDHRLRASKQPMDREAHR